MATTANYTIDACVAIFLARHTPRDTFPSMWAPLDDLITAGRARMPRDVAQELERGTDDCPAWARSHPGFITEPTAEEVTIAVAISTTHPEWVREQKNAADPWVIAHAAATDSVIVTLERESGPQTAERNLRIPNIAREHGVSCLSFIDLIRREGLTI